MLADLRHRNESADVKPLKLRALMLRALMLKQWNKSAGIKTE